MVLLAPRFTLHASRARPRYLALVHHGISSPRSQPGIWNPQAHLTNTSQQGGKNRRRGKNENDNEKRELTFKEEGQGTSPPPPSQTSPNTPLAHR